jgi:acyl carrier protein
MALAEERLVDYVRRKIGARELDRDTALFSDGTIDSVGMVDLIVFLEAEADVIIAADDVTLDNFDSVARIVTFLAGRSPA